MTLFNADAWIAYKTGQIPGYRFADPQAAVQRYPHANRRSVERSEYRQGLMNTAQGSISLFDKNDDGKLSAREYYREQNYFHQFMTGMDVDRRKINKEFKALDINGDGFIDYKERANELSYLDRTKDSGRKNGVIDQDASYNEGYLLDHNYGKLQRGLRNNYNRKNDPMGTLGEDGDINKALTLNTQSNPFGQGYDYGYGYDYGSGCGCGRSNNSNSFLGNFFNLLIGNLLNPYGSNNCGFGGYNSMSGGMMPVLFMLSMMQGQQYRCY